MLEIATGVCRDIHQAATQLSAIQQAVHARRPPSSADLRRRFPPFHAWQRQQISDNPRYVKTVEHFGYLAQQATIFGQHVHVGCQNGDDAIYLLHGLSRFVRIHRAECGLAVARRHRQRFCLFAPEPVRRLS
jgi:carboxylate-amine ligase